MRSDCSGALLSAVRQEGNPITLESNSHVTVQLDADGNNTSQFAVQNDAGANAFSVREDGDVRLLGTLTELSDVHARQDIAEVDPGAALDALMGVPITTWCYRHSPDALHLGPMAQDVHAVFGLGSTDTGISTVDRDGVALAAIQGLYRRLQQRDAQVAAQQVRIAELEAQLAALSNLEARVLALERS